jgi:6,7-dimethyl-8-ribityllumazine synthase
MARVLRLALTALTSAAVLIALVATGSLVRGSTAEDTVSDGVERLLAAIATTGVCMVLVVVFSQGRRGYLTVPVVLGAVVGAVIGLWLLG